MSITAIGRTLISAEGQPLGFGGVYFDENTDGHKVAVLFFYGGPNQVFIRKYLRRSIAEMTLFFERLRDMGIFQVYALADRKIPQSHRFIRWLGGAPCHIEQAEGELYVIELAKNPLLK